MLDHEAGSSRLLEAPYYLPVADEVDVFFAAYEQRLPVLLKGPTGCGKTPVCRARDSRAISREQGIRTAATIGISAANGCLSRGLVGH